MGYDTRDWAGKPVIAILNTWSELNTCHAHFRQRAEEVKRGVWQTGGFPVEIPVMSLSEIFMKPSAMLSATCWRWRPRRRYGATRSTGRC